MTKIGHTLLIASGLTACATNARDKSLATAHGLEELYEAPQNSPGAGAGVHGVSEWGRNR